MVAHLRLAPDSRHASGGRGPDRRPIRVVLADDHDLMRTSLRGLLDGEADVQVVAETGDQAEAIRLVRKQRPSVMVLDLRMQGGSSIETIAHLRKHVPGTRVVVTTMESSPAFARRAFEAGAAGFVVKDLAVEELVEAVRTAARGERYAGPRIAHVLRPLLAAASL